MAHLPGCPVHPVPASLCVCLPFLSSLPWPSQVPGALLDEPRLSGSKWYKDTGLPVVATADPYERGVPGSAMGLKCQQSHT